MTYRRRNHQFVTQHLKRLLRRITWAHIKPVGNITLDSFAAVKRHFARKGAY